MSRDANRDAATELARHFFDLRVHALVMLAGALLVGYCWINILDIGGILALATP